MIQAKMLVSIERLASNRAVEEPMIKDFPESDQAKMIGAVSIPSK